MTISKQGRERLERLANLLEGLPEDGSAGENGLEFYLGTWMMCGTTACACGHAAMDPWFRRRGLVLQKEEDDYWISFDGHEHLNAAAAFFDVEMHVAERLFMPRDYTLADLRNPHAVAARIRELLA